eukprot:gb/GECG01006461.1/.p1 GENE.gb/GECG01006461.1/~~gb/GECG01006461.1/.p1  ORF type:complete len:227 (+),score=17.18 gb/GECG01006461.1/:1-681(+)
MAPTSRSQSMPFMAPTVSVLCILLSVPLSKGQTGTDLRSSVISGKEPCILYSAQYRIFNLTCPVKWVDSGYDRNTFITLQSAEIFEGNDNEIDLRSVSEFRGLFEINSTAIDGDQDIPVVRNVRMKNGETMEHAGFVIRRSQQYAIVRSCSSTGTIGIRGGGICGRSCGTGGRAKLVNCFSNGRIGRNGGGITGLNSGSNHGIVEIMYCHSSGSIASVEFVGNRQR